MYFAAFPCHFKGNRQSGKPPEGIVEGTGGASTQVEKERRHQCLLNYVESITRLQQMNLFALLTIQQQVAAIATR